MFTRAFSVTTSPTRTVPVETIMNIIDYYAINTQFGQRIELLFILIIVFFVHYRQPVL